MTDTPLTSAGSFDADPRPPAGAEGGERSTALSAAHAVAQAHGWYFVDLDDPAVLIPGDVLALLDASMARRLNSMPVQADAQKVFIATENPDDFSVTSQLRGLFPGRSVRFIYADPGAIRRKIEKVYSAATEAAEVAGRRMAKAAVRNDDGGDLGRVASTAEGDNVKFLRLLLEQALRDGASDVHVEPIAENLLVRFRVDGKLREVGKYPASRGAGLLTLIKVESRMRTDNFMKPDSGVMIFEQPGKKPIDMRVETAPTAWGQSCVMRLQSDIWRPLNTLGFSDYNFERYYKAIKQPFGVVLATGPTGSGKSTTLYASLNERISVEEKIITLENPIEYKAPSGISQMAIVEDQGMTFASGLRSILRQDPDIILVGEIRDQETAETAVDAAMTGHLVFSTLHTNDAPGSIPRLTRMGIEPLMLADSLLAVLGQRLLRRLCDSCKIAETPDLALIEEAGFKTEGLPEVVYNRNMAGCNDCRQSGWAGRVPVHEVMLVGESLADAIATNAPQPVIKQLARENGMVAMRDDGFGKFLAGMTTIAEIDGSTRRSMS